MFNKTIVGLVVAGFTASLANAAPSFAPAMGHSHLDLEKSEVEIKREARLAEEYKQVSQSIIENGYVSSERVWDGEVTVAPVLTILIDFPDYGHHELQQSPSGHYTPGFPVEHYQNLIYSEDGYTHVNGEHYQSMNSFLIDQSGGSFKVEGEVFGWYTANHPAAFYGAGRPDLNPRALVIEAVNHAVSDPRFNLSDYDVTDEYDFDGDGNLFEPDGVIDHLSIIHSSVGHEWGGGDLGSDAIWSHRWTVNNGSPVLLDDNVSLINNYVIQPIDGAAGVLTHEFGHDLGLADEYDTEYSPDDFGTPGSTVGAWSVMGSGSDAGIIPGTQPVGYSPFAKIYLQNKYGGNWVRGTSFKSSELNKAGVEVKLNQASSKGLENDVVIVEANEINKQLFTPLGSSSYNLNLDISALYAPINLIGHSEATLSFDVNKQDLNGNGDLVVRLADSTGFNTLAVLTPKETQGLVVGNNGSIGLTGNTNGWVTLEYDLSEFADQFFFAEITFVSLGASTGSVYENFVAVDNVQVTSDQFVISNSNADDTFDFYTYQADISNGVVTSNPYYLLEWRQHHGVDKGLESIGYEEGLLVWYVDPIFINDDSFVLHGDNATGVHPGEGWMGVVDADRNPLRAIWSYFDVNHQWLGDSEYPLSSTRQIKDAPFNTENQIGGQYTETTDFGNYYEVLSASDHFILGNPKFIDWDDYSNYIRPATGRKLPAQGLIFEVVDQTEDGSQATINISNAWNQ